MNSRRRSANCKRNGTDDWSIPATLALISIKTEGEGLGDIYQQLVERIPTRDDLTANAGKPGARQVPCFGRSVCDCRRGVRHRV